MPVNSSFWSQEEMILYEVLLPFIKRTAIDSANNGVSVVSQLVDRPVASLGIDFDRLDMTATRWAEQNTFNVVKQISETNMDVFLREFPKWQESRKPIKFLIDAITPEYGLWRAEAIAVTEYGRAVSHGNIIGWQETGLVQGKKAVTVNDNDVSEICVFLNETVVPLNGYFVDQNGVRHFAPPFHVRCRTRIKPVLTL